MHREGGGGSDRWGDVHRCIDERELVILCAWAELDRAAAFSVRDPADLLTVLTGMVNIFFNSLLDAPTAAAFKNSASAALRESRPTVQAICLNSTLWSNPLTYPEIVGRQDEYLYQACGTCS